MFIIRPRIGPQGAKLPWVIVSTKYSFPPVRLRRGGINGDEACFLFAFFLETSSIRAQLPIHLPLPIHAPDAIVYNGDQDLSIHPKSDTRHGHVRTMTAAIPTGQLIGSTIEYLVWFGAGAYLAWFWPRRIRHQVHSGKISHAKGQAKLKKLSPVVGYLLMIAAIAFALSNFL